MGLEKTLGAGRGTALMLNIVLGAGLLTLPGLAFQAVGPDALGIWLICALASVPLLVVFALIGQHFPNAGGIPAMAGAQFGRIGYVCATFLFFGAVILGLPGVALTGGHYAATLIDAPPFMLAIMLVVLATGINFLSAGLAGRLNGLMASGLIIVLLAVVVMGGYGVQGAAFVPPSWHYPLPAYISVFMMVFFAFTGWEVAAHLSEEFHTPARDIPRAMAFSFIIATAFYVALAFIVGASGLTGGYEAPFAAIFTASYGAGAGAVMALVAVLLIFANLSAAIWAVSRMVYSAAREGLLPSALSKTRGGTPVRAVMAVLGGFMGVISLAAYDILPLSGLLEYAGQNFLILYAVAGICLIAARPSVGESCMAVIAVAIVGMILALRGSHAMIYPAGLITLGLLTARMIKPPAPPHECG